LNEKDPKGKYAKVIPSASAKRFAENENVRNSESVAI